MASPRLRPLCRAAFATIGLMSVSAWAQRERPFFQASRALAMGDAYTAHDVGFEAVYYNPAGVARPASAQAKFVDIEFLMSQGAVSLFGSSFTSLAAMSKIVKNVTASPGNPQALGISFLPQFLVKNFSLGIVTRTYADAYVDTSNANLNFYATTDLALYADTGLSLFGGVLKIGVGAKALDRAEVNRAYTPDEYANGLSFAHQFQEGVGYGIDAGLLATYPSELMPTLGIAVLDVGNTKLLDRRVLFTGAGNTPGAPPSLAQKVNVGISLNPKHGPGAKSTFSFELKDTLHVKSAGTAQERFHLGYELNLHNFMYVRAGLNQGRYWTAGLGLQGRFTALEFATYGENISLNPGGRQDDRKYVVRYVFGF